jgi:hypothetical protein
MRILMAESVSKAPIAPRTDGRRGKRELESGQAAAVAK